MQPSSARPPAPVAAKRVEFRIRDLLVTRIPSLGELAANNGCDCDSACSNFTGHPVHTDFCGFGEDRGGYPAPDLAHLRGLVRYAAALSAAEHVQDTMHVLSVGELDEVESTLTTALKAVRAQREALRAGAKR